MIEKRVDTFRTDVGRTRIELEYGIDEYDPNYPYFSITASIWYGFKTGSFKQEPDISGACHEEILKYYPEFENLIKMHLRDANTGKPLYAYENAWFWFNAESHDSESYPLNYPPGWKNMQPYERAAAYLKEDPKLFKNVTSKTELYSVIDTLLPKWGQEARDTIEEYNLKFRRKSMTPEQETRLNELIDLENAANTGNAALSEEEFLELDELRNLYLNENLPKGPTEPLDTIFFVDSRASSVNIFETMQLLTQSHPIKTAIINPTTECGVALETTFDELSIETTSEMYGVDLITMSGKTFQQNLDAIIAGLPARIVVIPAPIGSGQHHIDLFQESVEWDLSPNTLPGAVIQAAATSQRKLILIDVPERGLVRHSNNTLYRRMMHLGLEPLAEIAEN